MLWKKGSQVYLLRDPDGKVWIMQAYTNLVDKALTAADLPNLASKLKPPPGWKYEVKTLDKDFTYIPPASTGHLTHAVSDDLQNCRDEVRWFPAMVSNHVMDLIERYGWDSDIPSELTDYVKARKFYDYKDHSRVGAKHGEFVPDEIVDRFCVLGTVEDAAKKLKELESVGVDQFNIYLMTHAQEETLKAYGDEIIPQFSSVAA